MPCDLYARIAFNIINSLIRNFDYLVLNPRKIVYFSSLNRSMADFHSNIKKEGESSGVELRFCPNSNDLLYPKEDRARKKLIFVCRNCDYSTDAADHCVYRNNIMHSSDEKTSVIQDVRIDPTLPRSRDIRCARCEAMEAVFFSLVTTEGMSLYFQCVSCGNKWKDTGDAIEG